MYAHCQDTVSTAGKWHQRIHVCRVQVAHTCKEAASVSRAVALLGSVCCGGSFSLIKSSDEAGWCSRVAALVCPGCLQAAGFGVLCISSSEEQTSKKRVGIAVSEI